MRRATRPAQRRRSRRHVRRAHLNKAAESQSVQPVRCSSGRPSDVARDWGRGGSHHGRADLRRISSEKRPIVTRPEAQPRRGPVGTADVSVSSYWRHCFRSFSPRSRAHAHRAWIRTHSRGSITDTAVPTGDLLLQLQPGCTSASLPAIRRPPTCPLMRQERRKWRRARAPSPSCVCAASPARLRRRRAHLLLPPPARARRPSRHSR